MPARSCEAFHVGDWIAMTAPKLFISYSWSSPEHQQWVIDFATELRQSGVDVILDKWDLKEGHDAVAFMEKMVTAPDIKKVAIICDAKYASKADNRLAGVGTETQIISKEVYDNQTQEKFVAIIRERHEDGKPILPTYYKSRVYIDLCDGTDTYPDNFEQLLRWIFDKPLHVKPELGNRPAFLSQGGDEAHISLGTSAIFKRCMDAIKGHKPHALATFEEYWATFSSSLEKFRISNPLGEFDDAVIASIENFIPFRNEAIQVISAVATHQPEQPYIYRLHRFFESVIPYLDRPEGASSWRPADSDNYRFIIHELFLYNLAILLKHEHIELVSSFLQEQYFSSVELSPSKEAMISFVVFRQYAPSFERRSDRLDLNRFSLRADLLKERCAGTGLDFRHLLQADFVAFMRAEIESKTDYERWWPETLLYASSRNSHGPCEIFARSSSRGYFDRVKKLLAIETAQDLERLFKSYREGLRMLPKWQFNTLNPAALLGYEKLATRP